MKHKKGIIVVLGVLLLTIIGGFWMWGKQNHAGINTEEQPVIFSGAIPDLSGINLEEFYPHDEFMLTRMLLNSSGARDFRQVDARKFYGFNYFLFGRDSDKISEDDKRFKVCIEDFVAGKNLDQYSSMTDKLSKSICLGEDTMIGEDNPRLLRENLSILLQSKNSKGANRCSEIRKTDDLTASQYFRCIGLAFNWRKADQLMRLYVYSDFEASRCGSLRSRDAYLYTMCSSVKKIWEHRPIAN